MTPIQGSSSNAEEPDYDYTEGASALDIDQALNNSRLTRRDSQYSFYNDNGDGSMFSGPGHTVNPSSVSRMSHMELGRRSSDNWMSRRRSMDSRQSNRNRRDSRDSQVSRQSIERPGGYEDAGDLDSQADEDRISATSKTKGRRKSPPQRVSVFENIAHLFGRSAAEPSRSRRPSISQRSSTSRRSSRADIASEHALDTEDEDEDRWGYSSGEEDSDNDSLSPVNRDNASITASMAYDSEPPSPIEGHQSLPLLDIDPVFGREARIEMDTSFTLLSPPPPGLPSRQTIYIADEDSTVRFVGYETVPLHVWLWRLCSLLTFGILSLLGHWFPRLWLRWAAREKAFIESHNGFLVVEVKFLEFVSLYSNSYALSRLTKLSTCFQFELSHTHITYLLYFPQSHQQYLGLKQNALDHPLILTQAKMVY